MADEQRTASESVVERRRRESAAFLASESEWREPQSDVLTGPARVPRPSGGFYEFQLRIELPFHFPSNSSEPTVTVVSHDLGRRLTIDDHVTGGDKLCLHMAHGRDIDYATGGLTELITQVAIHLHRIVLRHHGGTYPGPAHAHGAEGLLNFERERLVAELQRYADPLIEREIPGRRAKCPCASGKRFGDCCEEVVRSVRHRFREIRQRQRDLARLSAGTSRTPLDALK